MHQINAQIIIFCGNGTIGYQPWPLLTIFKSRNTYLTQDLFSSNFFTKMVLIAGKLYQYFLLKVEEKVRETNKVTNS